MLPNGGSISTAIAAIGSLDVGIIRIPEAARLGEGPAVDMRRSYSGKP
jgi:hypothetical protein